MLRAAAGGDVAAPVVQLPVAEAAELAAAGGALDRLLARLADAGADADANAESAQMPTPAFARKYECTRIAFNLRLARCLLKKLDECATLAASRFRAAHHLRAPAPLLLDHLAAREPDARRHLAAFASVVRHTRLNLIRVLVAAGTLLLPPFL